MNQEIPSQTPASFNVESLMQKLEEYDRNRLDLLDEGRIAQLTVAELAAHPEAAGTILNVVYNFIFDKEGAIFDSQRSAIRLSPRGQVSALNEYVHAKARYRMHYVFRAVVLITAEQNAKKTSGAADPERAIQGQVAKEAMEVAMSPS